jgi:hypothetical protein
LPFFLVVVGEREFCIMLLYKRVLFGTMCKPNT